MKPTVAILYGLGEGRRVGKAFVKALHEQGFEVIVDASQADYVIVHSGGLIYVPKTYKAKVFLLVGVSDRLDGSVFDLQYRKIKLDFAHTVQSKRYIYWLNKSFWNIIYIIGKMQRTLSMWKVVHSGKPFFPEIKHAQVIVVNYKDDPWSGNLTKKDIEKFPNYTLITRTGIHDDLWINPDYYINLLSNHIIPEV